MKLYVITIDEVFDFQGFKHTPIVKKTMQEAKSEMDRIIKEVEAEGFAEDWVRDDYDEYSTSFSTYPDGEWGTSHYDITIYEVEVEL